MTNERCGLQGECRPQRSARLLLGLSHQPPDPSNVRDGRAANKRY